MLICNLFPFLLLTSFVSGQDVPVSPARPEIQLSIMAKKPGTLIQDIADEIYVFIPNIDTDGISISCFPRADIAPTIPEYLKNCTIFPESERNVVLTDLHELSTGEYNTKVFNKSVGINCRGVNTSAMGIVVQDGGSIKQFKGNYQMVDLEVQSSIGVKSFESGGKKIGFTTVSFNGALTRIFSANYLSDQKYFSVSDSTPEKPSQVWVSEKYALPATYITSNTLFTTFFFDDVHVIIRIVTDEDTLFCAPSQSIFQLEYSHYIYPPEQELTQSSFSGVLSCRWNFIAREAYYIQFSLLGVLESSSQIDIRDEQGTGVFFSADYSTSTDYKGSLLNTTFTLPSSGSLVFSSSLGMGSFSFKAEFLLFDVNKPVETRVIGVNDSSYLINMNVLQTKQFFFATTSYSLTFQLGIFAALTYVHRSYIQALDNCFIEANDIEGVSHRQSLRTSFECGPPRLYKSALVSCIGDDVLNGYLLVNGYENASINLVGEACTRMASSLKSFLLSGIDSSPTRLTALMVIEDDSVETVSLIYMDKNGTDPLIVVNGGIFGEQIANISDSTRLPFYTQKKLVTYRLPSTSAAVLNFTVLETRPIPIANCSARKYFIGILAILFCYVSGLYLNC